MAVALIAGVDAMGLIVVQQFSERWRVEKGKKKASDGRHDARNPDGFNGPLEY
jgi:hypothetical protein